MKEESEKAGLTFKKQRSWRLIPLLHGKSRGKQRKERETIFLGSKITADGECSHEIKRYLLLERKTMTNLGRDITVLTKVYIVKAMVFPVVVYRYECWTIRVEC